MTISIVKRPILVFALAFFAALFFTTGKADAHCNSLDGPVVTAAAKALEEENVNRILIWVKKKDEDEISDIFKKALKVRKQGPDAKDLADKYLFENLVRIHRKGEGATYDGLLPAGHDFGPAIRLTDKAFENGNINPVLSILKKEDSEGVKRDFQAAYALKNFHASDLDAGREYIEAYVKFIHHVQELYSKEHPENSTEEGESHETGIHEENSKVIENKNSSTVPFLALAFLAGAGVAGGTMKILRLKKR